MMNCEKKQYKMLVETRKNFNEIRLHHDIKTHIKVAASDDSLNMKLTILTTS
jgi:hypothetical protein